MKETVRLRPKNSEEEESRGEREMYVRTRGGGERLKWREEGKEEEESVAVAREMIRDAMRRGGDRRESIQVILSIF